MRIYGMLISVLHGQHFCNGFVRNTVVLIRQVFFQITRTSFHSVELGHICKAALGTNQIKLSRYFSWVSTFVQSVPYKTSVVLTPLLDGRRTTFAARQAEPNLAVDLLFLWNCWSDGYGIAKYSYFTMAIALQSIHVSKY